MWSALRKIKQAIKKKNQKANSKFNYEIKKHTLFEPTEAEKSRSGSSGEMSLPGMVEIVVDRRNWILSKIVRLRVNREKKIVDKSEEADADWEQKKNWKSHGKIQNSKLNFISKFSWYSDLIWNIYCY